MDKWSVLGMGASRLQPESIKLATVTDMLTIYISNDESRIVSAA